MLHEDLPLVNSGSDTSDRKSAEAERSGADARAKQVTRVVIEMQRSSDISTFFIHAVAAKTGINPTDLKVLSILSRQGSLSAGRIAELTGLTTGAITFMIDRLEKAGYVQRVRHSTDRRIVLIELIPEPLQRATGSYFADMARVTVDAAKHYTDEQLELVIDFLEKVNTAAEEVVKGLNK
ncbi:MAG TPA: MarR family transcriptional regulator [Ktedonobacteraceae bacterium]|nr:MarR family transcriptional regulator [Ktedonobacteraceae bacterium]